MKGSHTVGAASGSSTFWSGRWKRGYPFPAPSLREVQAEALAPAELWDGARKGQGQYPHASRRFAQQEPPKGPKSAHVLCWMLENLVLWGRTGTRFRQKVLVAGQSN